MLIDIRLTEQHCPCALQPLQQHACARVLLPPPPLPCACLPDDTLEDASQRYVALESASASVPVSVPVPMPACLCLCLCGEAGKQWRGKVVVMRQLMRCV